MNEPANLTAVVDVEGDTWVRVDGCPDPYGSPYGWWQICDGRFWTKSDTPMVFGANGWDAVKECGPLTAADPDRTARAIALVRRAVAS